MRLFGFLSFPWVGTGICEIRFSHIGKNSGNPDLVTKRFFPDHTRFCTYFLNCVHSVGMLILA